MDCTWIASCKTTNFGSGTYSIASGSELTIGDSTDTMFVGILKASSKEQGGWVASKIVFDLPTKHGIALLIDSIGYNLLGYNVYVANKSGETINKIVGLLDATGSFRMVEADGQESTVSVNYVSHVDIANLENNSESMLVYAVSNLFNYLIKW